MTLNTQRKVAWTRFRDAQPTEAGIYEWRIPSKAVPSAVLIVAAKMRMRGAGFENVLSPEFDYWDGYRVHVLCDVEWRATEFSPAKNQRTPHILSIEGLDISPCSCCGQVPRIEAHQSDRFGTTICPDPWNLNSWRLICCEWGSTPRMADPREAERIRRETRCRGDTQAAEIERLRDALRQEAGWHDDQAKNYRAQRGISQTPVSDGLLAEWHKQRAQSIRAALSGEANGA